MDLHPARPSGRLSETCLKPLLKQRTDSFKQRANDVHEKSVFMNTSSCQARLFRTSRSHQPRASGMHRGRHRKTARAYLPSSSHTFSQVSHTPEQLTRGSALASHAPGTIPASPSESFPRFGKSLVDEGPAADHRAVREIPHPAAQHSREWHFLRGAGI